MCRWRTASRLQSTQLAFVRQDRYLLSSPNFRGALADQRIPNIQIRLRLLHSSVCNLQYDGRRIFH